MTGGAAEALAFLGAGKTDLAVGRGDLEMPADAQIVAIVRKKLCCIVVAFATCEQEPQRKAKAENQGDRRPRGAQSRRDWPDLSEPRVVTAHFDRRRCSGAWDHGNAIWHGSN
jgi:hypothetical protein